jgi:hypothetical protein
MSGEPGSEISQEGKEPWISREEIVARDVEQRRREYEEAQRWIEERCREAEERWRAARPWLGEPGLCRTVPVRSLSLPTPEL